MKQASIRHSDLRRQKLRRYRFAALGGLVVIFAAVGVGAYLTAEAEISHAPEMVRIPGGTFQMGIDEDVKDSHHARPRHKVHLSPFWIGKTEVTNRQWQEFVEDTGYKTIAETKPTKEEFPDAPEEKLVPFSAVFAAPEKVEGLQNHLQWWKAVPGADWRHPEGPESSIEERMNHPVVHISWADADEYCKWLSKKTGQKYRLPTEAEWEFAARGGQEDSEFVWGSELPKDGEKWPANIWQGQFPKENTKADGFETTAPVGSYPANKYGLYDMSGNVWEWCQDWYQPDFYQYSALNDPQGPVRGAPRHPGEGPARVQRGGSFLCCDEYCRNYRTWTRHSQTPDSAANHVGFRVVREED